MAESDSLYDACNRSAGYYDSSCNALGMQIAVMNVNGQSKVPPGFRFYPTDEELIDYYLTKKVACEKIDLDVIREVDLNKLEPWDIQEKCNIGSTPQNDWYFFSHKDKKYPTGSRTNRATAAGFWKATGRDKVIHSSLRRIGMRKTLKFYQGRAPHGQKSDWIMHEYRLDDNIITTQDSTVNGNILPSSLQELAHPKFSLEDIVPATNNFDNHVTIGLGGYGKILRSGQSIDKQRELLYNTKDKPLTWVQRLEICVAIAHGLQYLHTGAEHTIHREIKSSNILLDDNWYAKISDFGLSKIGPTMDHSHLWDEDTWRWISVRIMRGKTICLNVRPSDTIRDLKLKIPLSEWIYTDLPNLFYKGEHLNDNCTLDSYNISWFSTLECRFGLNISVRTMSGKTVSVKVASSNTTISNLKAKIQDKEGVPQFQQKLFFNGRQLENKCTLAHYKIEDGSTLLLVRRSKGWIPIYVKTHTGKTISREVKSCDTIGDVKVNITDMVGVPPYNQTLFFAGEELLDDRTLYDYHIYSESTLSLVPVCRGRMKIYAETIDGNTIPLDVICWYTIGEVKSLIQDKEGIPTHMQTLVYAGQKLDDSRTLVYYLIKNETTLRLVDNTLMRREPVQIHVEIVATGRTIPLQVQTFDTINSVKSKIQSQEGIPCEQQRLFLPQIQLKDDCTLADYYIQNESTLHLVVTLIKIAVKTPVGKIITLHVDSSDTVWNVKAKIQDAEEIPHDHQKLFLAEEQEQLQNSSTIAKCCVKTESTLHLLVTSDQTGY